MGKGESEVSVVLEKELKEITDRYYKDPEDFIKIEALKIFYESTDDEERLRVLELLNKIG